MVKYLLTFVLLALLNMFLSLPSAYAIDVMSDELLESVTASEGIEVIIPEFRYSFVTDHMAIGGDDGLGIPEAPDGAWFVMDTNRLITLDLSGATFDIGFVAIGRNDTSYHHALRDAVFNNETDDVKSAVQIDFGEADFYSFSSDAQITLKFGNNMEGTNTGGALFSKEIATFQIDGATMTVKSDDAKMFVFSHPDGNFDITPP